jgi:tetratricopeptide (TPR) repeat protein
MLPIPDRRAMERVMADLVGNIQGRRPGKRAEKNKAQELIYAAWETSGEERIELALQAIETDPDRADAYVILAEAASDIGEARDLYAQGLEAGERSLGKEAFEEDAGHFWSVLETRPYMRARAGLAQCLWALGENEAAVGHYRDMLRLNPNDNQGIRYLLLSCLQEIGRDAEAWKLLEQYSDEASAAWTYSWALADFRRNGDSPEARKRLQKAFEVNSHVPAYLAGRKRIPGRLPDYIGFGDESEAFSYAAENLEAWKKTPGALAWLGSVPGDSRSSRGTRRRAR